MKTHGPWKITGSQDVYRDPWIQVRQDQVIRPDGQPGTHCVVKMKAGVSVLPLDDQGDVYLTWEFHYAIGRYGLEVVSGGMETGEDPLVTASRELREELGIVAKTFTRLTVVDPFTTIIHSPTTLYLAEGLQFVDPAHEGTEQIERIQLPLQEALALVQNGTITHGPSCILILQAWMLRRSHG